jgi:hypothetical protein
MRFRQDRCRSSAHIDTDWAATRRYQALPHTVLLVRELWSPLASVCRLCLVSDESLVPHDWPDDTLPCEVRLSRHIHARVCTAAGQGPQSKPTMSHGQITRPKALGRHLVWLSAGNCPRPAIRKGPVLPSDFAMHSSMTDSEPSALRQRESGAAKGVLFVGNPCYPRLTD